MVLLRVRIEDVREVGSIGLPSDPLEDAKSSRPMGPLGTLAA